MLLLTLYVNLCKSSMELNIKELAPLSFDHSIASSFVRGCLRQASSCSLSEFTEQISLSISFSVASANIPEPATKVSRKQTKISLCSRWVKLLLPPLRSWRKPWSPCSRHERLRTKLKTRWTKETKNKQSLNPNNVENARRKEILRDQHPSRFPSLCYNWLLDRYGRSLAYI
jgi:hypothetical protein